ncbi:unnamed protein product, partial [Didymodactylos carnosus]
MDLLGSDWNWSELALAM